jgi:mannose-1-phosphate guanylyltransferase
MCPPPAVSNVVRFREKPNAELAEAFFRQGNFRWNAGMFIWSIQAIFGALRRFQPQLGEFVGKLHGDQDFDSLLRDEFRACQKSRSTTPSWRRRRACWSVEASFDWDDVGSWTAIAKYLEKDGAENRANSPLSTIESANNIVFSEPSKARGAARRERLDCGSDRGRVAHLQPARRRADQGTRGEGAGGIAMRPRARH